MAGKQCLPTVKDGALPFGGTQATKKLRFDARRAQEVFGVVFVGFEVQVRALTAHYLELVAREKGREMEREEGASARVQGDCCISFRHLYWLAGWTFDASYGQLRA